MNKSSLTAPIALEFTTSSWYSCLQAVRITLAASGRIRAVLVGGEDTQLCHNLVTAWLEIVDRPLSAIASSDSYGQTSDRDITKYNRTLLKSETSESHGITQQRAFPSMSIPVITLKGVEGSLLVLSAGLNFWMQVSLIPTTEYDNQIWRISLMLDSQKIADLLADRAIAEALSYSNQFTTEDLKNNGNALKCLWMQLLPLINPAFFPQENLENNAKTLSTIFTPPIEEQNQKKERIFDSVHLPIEPLFWESPIGIIYQSLDGGILRANPAFEKLTGYPEAQLRRLDCRAICHPEDFAIEVRHIQQLIQGNSQKQPLQKRYLARDGHIVWAEVTISLLGNIETDDSYLLVFVKDLSYLHRAEQELQQRRQWESLLSEIAATIRSTFDLPKILEIAVRRLRVALNTDRVLAYQLQADRSGICAAEAVNPAYPSIWGKIYSEECIPANYLRAYSQGRLWQTADIYTENLSSCHIKMLEEMKVRSMMAAAIQRPDEELEPLQSRSLWGLIFIHHCRAPRQWTADEQQLLQAVANQVAIAFEQSLRVQQLQAYTQELEQMVKQRTRKLTRSLQFEQLIRQLNKTLSQEDLAEDQMLQAAVEGLVETLEVDGCYASLFDPDSAALEVRYEHLRKVNKSSQLIPTEDEFIEEEILYARSLIGRCFPLADFPEHLRLGFLAGKSCAVRDGILAIGNGEEKLPISNGSLPVSNCRFFSLSPISDAQGSIGAIWIVIGEANTHLFTTPYKFGGDEIKLVEQVANQCAIAIRQSRTWRRLQAQNEELEALNRLKGELVANTSHELRTPLTAILGFSSVLLQECFGKINSKQREYVERINSSGQHLLEVINDILDLSRIEAGRLDLELQLVFIWEIVEEAIGFIQERIKDQGLTLEVDVDPSIEYFVADSRRLKQMLLNLLSNAVKFTSDGKVGLKVYRSGEVTDGSTPEKINFLVWDTGIGIDMDDQGRLFSPFSQIDSSLSRRYPGSGLGLVITRRLAELHGGSILLESRKGYGSRFTLSLPLHLTAQELTTL